MNKLTGNIAAAPKNIVFNTKVAKFQVQPD